MKAHLQGVEIEAVRRRDHDLAVEHAVFRQALEQRVVQLRKVAVERPQIAALDLETIALLEHDRPEAVPFRLVEHVALRREHVGELREHRLDRRRHRGRRVRARAVSAIRRATRRGQSGSPRRSTTRLVGADSAFVPAGRDGERGSREVRRLSGRRRGTARAAKVCDRALNICGRPAATSARQSRSSRSPPADAR
jgi:hypothetical protein